MPKCLVSLNVQFWYDYEYHPAEKSTMTYPGCREHIIANDVEIPEDLYDYLMSNEFAADVEEQCLEDWKERNEPHI